MKYIINYRGKSIEIKRLPNGKFMRPNLAQFTKNGLGSVWLDDCRIPYENSDIPKDFGHKTQNPQPMDWEKPLTMNKWNPDKGRFPSHLLVSDDVLNDGRITKGNYISKSSMCDEEANTWGGTFQRNRGARGFDDSGSFSRYFSLDAWWDKKIRELPESVQKTFPFLIVPKASKSERDSGLNSMPKTFRQTLGEFKTNTRPIPKSGGFRRNIHPTCKPIKLMSYLITLGSREGDIILDPFCGSGTTCISAKILNRQYIGIEMLEEYIKIAEARIKAYGTQARLL